MLVVIVIIAILISLLMPSLSRAKEKARRVARASQLGQQIKGLITYSVNNKSRFLPGYRYNGSPTHRNDDEPWVMALETYEMYKDQYLGGSEKLFTCVNIKNMPMLHRTSEMLLGYNYNADKPGINAKRGTKFPEGLIHSAEAQTVPVFSDLNNWTSAWKRTMVAHTKSGGYIKANWYDNTNGGWSAIEGGSQGGNYAYINGSVGWKGLDELETFYVFPWGEGLDLLPYDVW